MKLISKEKAESKYCPYNIGETCQTEKCMGWVKVTEEINREDHSGGIDKIRDFVFRKGLDPCAIKRTGGYDKMIHLPSFGYCGANFYNKNDFSDIFGDNEK